ncbi:MAG: PEGA domain-containing protein [Myxococcales bacterium]|nr:PEGA domain-containing protein [Myxococcales bacterium]
MQTEAESARLLGGVPRGSLADVERVIAGARADYYEENAARAERTLVAAAEDLELLPPTPERWEDLLEVHTLLAWIRSSAGRVEEAEATLERLYRLDPDYGPSVNAYPTSLRNLAARVQKRMKAEARVALTVTTRPEGLSVFVGGRGVGKAPVTVMLPRGEYGVEASWGGRRGLPRVARVGQDASVELSAGLEGAVWAGHGPCLAAAAAREERLTMLVRMGALLGVDALVAVRQEEPSEGERYLVVSTVEVRSGEEAREAKVKLYAAGLPPGSVERLADFVATGEAVPPVEATRGQVASARPAAAPADAPKEAKLAPASVPGVVAAPGGDQRRVPVAGYVAGGAAAALAAGAAVFYARALADERGLESMRGAGAFAAGSEDQVRQLDGSLARNRTAAVGLAGAAVGAGLTSAALFLFGGGAAGEASPESGTGQAR